MALFFFDLVRPGEVEQDEIGVEFESLEAAYLDSYRAALDISWEMLVERKNPMAHSFEIRDRNGQVVLDLPFSEVLRPGGDGGAARGEQVATRRTLDNSDA